MKNNQNPLDKPKEDRLNIIIIVIIIVVIAFFALTKIALKDEKLKKIEAGHRLNQVVEIVDAGKEISEDFNFGDKKRTVYLMEMTEGVDVSKAIINEDNRFNSSKVDTKYYTKETDENGNIRITTSLNEDVFGKSIYLSLEKFNETIEIYSLVESINSTNIFYDKTLSFRNNDGKNYNDFDSLELVNSSFDEKRKSLKVEKEEKDKLEQERREREKEIKETEKDNETLSENDQPTINEISRDDVTVTFSIENVSAGQTIEVSGESDGVVTGYLKTIYGDKLSSDISSGGVYNFYFNPSIPSGTSGSFHLELNSVEANEWHIKVY